MQSAGARLEALDCAMTIDEPAPGVVLVSIEGTDIGRLGDAPFQTLAPLVAGDRRVALFIDARHARASIDVSGDWALWLARHRSALCQVSMLTASRFVQVTADFVRRFAELGEQMRIYTDPGAFELALSHALDDARAVHVTAPRIA
jgi:hypothetical protein